MKEILMGGVFADDRYDEGFNAGEESCRREIEEGRDRIKELEAELRPLRKLITEAWNLIP